MLLLPSPWSVSRTAPGARYQGWNIRFRTDGWNTYDVFVADAAEAQYTVDNEASYEAEMIAEGLPPAHSNYYMIRTPDGFLGYWDGDLLAGKGPSTNCPKSKACTFDSPEEANFHVGRLAAQDIFAEVVDRNGSPFNWERSEADGFR